MVECSAAVRRNSAEFFTLEECCHALRITRPLSIFHTETSALCAFSKGNSFLLGESVSESKPEVVRGGQSLYGSDLRKRQVKLRCRAAVSPYT